MKSGLRIILLWLSMYLFGAWFQRPLSFDNTFESTRHYPPDFPTASKPVDVNYRSDSLQAARLESLMWKYYNSGQWDMMYDSSQVLTHLCEHLLEQKFDSLVFEYWAAGFGCYGQSKVYLGEIREGTATMNEFFAIKKRVTGENYSLAYEYFGAGHMARELFEDSDLALDYYRQGDAISRKCLAPDNVDLVDGFLNMARGYWLKGDYSTAWRYYREALDFKDLPPYRKAYLFTDIGNHYAMIGDYENALPFYLKARPLVSRVGNEFDREIAIAETYLELGKQTNCFQQIHRCEKLFQSNEAKLKSTGHEADLLLIKARYFFAIKDFPKAITWFKASIATSEQNNGGKSSLATLAVWQKLAQTYLASGDLTSARSAINELLFREAKQFKTVDFSQNPNLASFTRQPYHLLTLQLKGQVFEKQFTQSGYIDNLKYALSAYQKADSLIDALRNTYRGTGSKNQLAGNAKPIYQRAIDCAFQLWKHTGQETFVDEAWRLSEKSKSLYLLESIRESEARQIIAIRPDDLSHEMSLKRNLNFYEKLIGDEQTKPTPNAARISSWNQAIFNLKNTQDSLLAVFKIRYPAYYRMKYNRQIATIAETQAKLPDNTALLSYFMGDSVLFTFLIDKTNHRVFREKTDGGFHQNIHHLRKTIHEFDPGIRRTSAQKRTDFEVFSTASYELYQSLLLQPLQQTQAKNLILIPDETLGFIPFAALLQQPVSPDAMVDYRSLPYLVKHYAIRLEYAATLVQEGILPTGSGGYLGMAPSFDGASIASRSLPDSVRFTRAFGDLSRGTVPTLRYNTEEIDSAKAYFSGISIVGTAATEAFFKKNAPDAAVIHLPTHALTNDVDPLYSTLLFSNIRADSTGENDGLLHAYELYNLRLKANLAVLSACNTGAGKVVKGEGIMSLARAFKFAGCPNVMMSLWAVNDLAGKDLVVDFFRELHTGLGKATALQAAQCHFLQQVKSDELTHPYYWATFVMIGDDDSVKVESSMPWPWLLLGFILALLGLILTQKRT